ncbi:MAG: c-type cytochrome domain-containing protein, partial [Planctomyces sp.]
MRTQTALSGSVGILRRLMMTGFVVVLTVSSCSLNEVRAEDQPHPDPSVAEVRFGRDILPILSDSCFSCHGPDEAHRKGDLRLDTPEGAASVLGDGNAAESELLRRITSTDPELVMPPADSGRKPLTEQQQLLLRRWIESGASWGKHWAFESPVKVEVPRSQEAGWDHPVDAFIHEKLEEIGLTASPSAAAHTVARRMAFDIAGLPPSSEMLSEFLADAKQNPDEAA